MAIDLDWPPSEAVARVQTALKQRGFDPGAVDGRFGPNTKKAVARFQRHHGGLPLNGQVDQRTWSALGLEGRLPGRPVRID